MTLDELFAIVEERRGGDPQASYVARSFAKGRANWYKSSVKNRSKRLSPR